VYGLPLRSATCKGSFVYPTLCSFKASYTSKVSLLSRYIRRGWTHINGRGDERPDIGPSRIFIDQLDGETLGSAGFSACSNEGSECSLDVDGGFIFKLGQSQRTNYALKRLITYIVPCPCVGISNTIKDKVTDTLQDESGGGLGF